MKKQILLFGLALATLASCTRIDAGHEGILIKQGSVLGKNSVRRGGHFLPWFQWVHHPLSNCKKLSE